MYKRHFKELVDILVTNNADDALIQDIAVFCKRQNRNFSFQIWWDAIRDARFKKFPIRDLI